ncbi:MAG TPA: hypothetical protein VKT77_15930 [Chthonomonadaceae bacterium]|nr:hypothetical protein [Chthonomonadaceae bacterium]
MHPIVELDDDAEDVDYYPELPQQSPARRITLALLRYLALAAVACGIAIGIVYIQNYGLLQAFAVQPSASAGGPASKAPNAGPAGARAPGVYINNRGAFVSPDGVKFEPTSSVPTNSSLPTYMKTDGQGYSRVR